jgi:hypothetical protein
VLEGMRLANPHMVMTAELVITRYIDWPLLFHCPLRRAFFRPKFLQHEHHACASIIRSENVIVARRCGRASARVRVREWGREARGDQAAKVSKSYKVITFGQHNYDAGRTATLLQCNKTPPVCYKTL